MQKQTSIKEARFDKNTSGIEDDSAIIENLSAVLKAEGFWVQAEAGQKEALEALQKESFDLLLLDVSLQNGNGFTVCSAVKAESDTPVIFLTASGDEFSVVTGLDLGAEDYIRKPFRPRELISRIRSVLRRCGKTGAIVGSLGICGWIRCGRW